MKHHLFLLLLPLLAIAFPCIIVAEGTTAQPVYDTENHEVTGRGSYYVLPAEHGTGGGGLRMFSTGRPCNFLVSQAHDEADVGIPVRFHPPDDHLFGGTILLSTNVTIRFSVPTICMQVMYWNVGLPPPLSSSPSQPGDRVAVGRDKRPSWPLSREFVFRIEKYGNATATEGYKLVACAAGQGPCGKDLGLYAYEERTWLAISDTPLVVVFKKYTIA